MNREAVMINNSTIILTIDDEEVFRKNLVMYLSDSGYTVIQASNGREGLELFRTHNPDLVLLDLRMPEMNGNEFLAISSKEKPETPVIVISGTGTLKDAIGALKDGAVDFIMKPLPDIMVLEHAIQKALERKELRQENLRYREGLERQVEERTSELRTLNQRLKTEVRERIFAEDTLIKSISSLRNSIEGAIKTIAYMAEIRDPYTGGHQQRVASLSKNIAADMGFPEDRIDGVFHAAMLHDIGKISIPFEILNRPGELSDMDRTYIQRHPVIGYEILRMIEFPWPVAQIVLQHHERLNGTGYPEGLTAEYILLEAKIIAVADVVESIATHRPYRASLGLDKALQEIDHGKNTLYDERVVESCISLFEKGSFHFDSKSLPDFLAHPLRELRYE